MLKKISVEHLSLGMHIHEFCGSWMDHPFWRTQFVLEDPADLHRIKTCGVNELWIDDVKGIDVAGPSKQEAESEIDATLAQIIHPQAVPRTSLEDELKRAAFLCAKSKDAVVSGASRSWGRC
jgi:hypothetical protein